MVHTVLCIYCTNPIAAGDLIWIDAGYSSGVNSNEKEGHRREKSYINLTSGLLNR